MNQKLAIFKEKIRRNKQKFSEWITAVYESPKKTFLFLALFVFTLLFLIQLLVILISNGFYNGASDDVCQYYPIMNNFFNDIRNGTLSWFNLNNYFGASFFSDVYYVPLDIFTFIAFLLNYLMPFSIAYSTTELIKLFAGVMILAYYFYLQGMKNRTIFWMGIIYLISGGTACFMAFPAFMSLAFYLPMSLVIIHWFYHKKAWVVPLFVCALVFYNFYAAYMVLAFMSILFIIESIKRTPFNLFWFLVNGVAFLSLILIGVVMSGVIIFPTIQFILEDTYRGTERFVPWVFEFGGIELELFKPEIYIRILAKAFTEQRSVGFLGFLGDYKYEHVSLYITVIGLAFMNYVFFMKDRISWIYKFFILAGVLMMIFPFFSYLFSGTDFVVGLITNSENIFGIPYTRWIGMIPLIQVVILAHVFDQHGFEKMKMKWLTIPLVLMLATVVYLFNYYYEKLSENAHFSAKEALIAEAVFLGIAGIYILLMLFFGWFKKMKWVKIVFWVEFGLAIGYIYGASFYLTNRIDLFQDMESINVFLNESLDQEEFYRVYVDVDRFNVQPENFNRMTTFHTNTAKIFHSWTDAETNKIGSLLFGASEAQEKKVMNIYTLYLNHSLSYKYLLLNAKYEYNLPDNYYTLIASNDLYLLYEIVDSEPFQVYEDYFTYDEFQSFAITSARRFSAQKLMMDNVLIDSDKVVIEDLNLNPGALISAGTLRDVVPTKRVEQAELVSVAGIDDTTIREFYRYDEADLDINFSVGALYLKSSGLSLSDYKEIFMTFENGDSKTCAVSTDTAHQIKCEFWEEPTAIYFEKTENFNEVREITFRMERAIDQAAYLVYDFSQEDLPATEGMMYFSFGQTLERMFVEDAQGNTSESIRGYLFFQAPPVRVYILKTGDMYKVANLYTSTLKYGFDDLTYYLSHADSPLSQNETLTIANSKITLSYTRTSDSDFDQIVMIPVAYSEEWIVTSETDYETLSVSGGFLGIIIPHGTTEVSITLEFVPKGLNTGAELTLGGIGLYALIFVPILIFKKGKKKKQTAVSEVVADEKVDTDRPVL